MHSTRAVRVSGARLALLAAALLAVNVACTGAAAPVAAPAADVAKAPPAQAAVAPAGGAFSQGGTIHWLGPATASVAVEEYGDFQ